MLKIRKLAVLATIVALASASVEAKAFFFAPTANAPGPFSVTMQCYQGVTMVSLGTKTFNLTDVTIANADESQHTVAIENNSFGGVQFAVGPGSTITQKFETPIRFIGAINSPYLYCDSTTSGVQVSIQGTVQ